MIRRQAVIGHCSTMAHQAGHHEAAQGSLHRGYIKQVDVRWRGRAGHDSLTDVCLKC